MQIATTSSAKGGRSRNEAFIGRVEEISDDDDGDDGGVCVVCGVKLAPDDTDERDRSDNWGELFSLLPLNLKYAL
jgi:hypothetical protein